MKNSEYWQKRFTKLEEAVNNVSDQYLKQLEKDFDKAIAKIERDIDVWYARLAANNEVSLARAKEMLSKKELKEFYWTLEEYIKYGEKNAITQEWVKELENASARVHIDRLTAIKLQMRQEVEVLTKAFEIGLQDTLTTVYEQTYYKSAYEIDKASNLSIGSNFNKLDRASIDKAVKKPWAVDGRTFDWRIWKNKEKLINTLDTNLTQSIIRGEDPQKCIDAVAKAMHTSKKNAGRLVMTESSFVYSASQLEAYKKLGVDKYEIVATLDTRTSEICRKLDGKGRSPEEPFFYLSEYKIGETAPPFHVRCRTCTCPYFDDFTEGEERAYRDADGKTRYVKDMTYEEWHKKHVEYSPKNGIIKTDKQFGKKAGRHARDFGLDPSNDAEREKMKDIIDDILVSNDEHLTNGSWRGQGKLLPSGRRADGPVDFYIKENDVVVVDKNNKFVTVLKGGTANERVIKARGKKV